MSPKICSNCILPETFPGIQFNESGVCNYCSDFKRRNLDFVQIKKTVENSVRQILQSQRQSDYGILLAFSGGKDSCYTLKYLKETFQAKILAYTIDNNFLSDVAKKNCDVVTSNLGVDHIFFKPNTKAMMEIYSTSLNKEIHSTAAAKRASSVCNSCIQLINAQLINFAVSQKIPIIAGGYLGGQIPSETGFMKQSLKLSKSMRESHKDHFSQNFSDEAAKYYEMTENQGLSEIAVLNPMTYLNLSEEAIIEEIKEIGWVRPLDTGLSSSNCRLNDYAIQRHIEKWHFHPYVAETATMVRRGTISRELGLEKMVFKPTSFEDIVNKLKRSM